MVIIGAAASAGAVAAGAAVTGTTLALFFATVCLVAAVVSMTHQHRRHHRRLPNFPGGPHRVPLLGNIPILTGTDKPYVACTELAKKHGDIYSLKLGDDWFLVLNSTELIRAAFVDMAEEFAGRPSLFSTEKLTEGYKDISFTDYTPEWRHHRRLFSKSLKSFTGGTRLESIVHERLGALEEYLDARLGQEINATYIIDLAVLGILTRLSFGYENDDIHEQMMRLIPGDVATLVIGKRMAVDAFHWMKHFSNKEKKFIKAVSNEFNGLINAEVQRHKETYDPSNIRDMIDELIKSQQEARDNGDTDLDFFSDTHISQTIANVLVGGGIGTGQSSYWALACMTENPHLQEKVSEVVEGAVGHDRMPALSDRSAIRYVEALVMEALRYASAAPIGVPRTTTRDVNFRGYRIPKGTPVLYNMYAVHFDEKNFEEPFEFKPERFLKEDGSIQHSQSYLPFNIGHRQCLGKTQGEVICFLVYSWLFHRYTFTKVPEHQDENLLVQNPMIQAARSPKPFKVIATKRY
ncbi:steroid 17-alpha-hydroxylase/17,20 lyase-like isoform X2 [Patiria miniata]|nr:steroid 17-alpha-hydroxylase/17,20 lyase-like isoform X2 [Patiria miniata]XP_038061893.1 steroid 17-alpha-hydroxylase/17,20 lyase-like isoform X2 [Patiria miniata]XP_038061894.1 steroid 17-alpha-hydroxylase/17,20 lyase-like isoform X2 [Patiria miniata]